MATLEEAVRFLRTRSCKALITGKTSHSRRWIWTSLRSSKNCKALGWQARKLPVKMGSHHPWNFDRKSCSRPSSYQMTSKRRQVLVFYQTVKTRKASTAKEEQKVAVLRVAAITLYSLKQTTTSTICHQPFLDQILTWQHQLVHCDQRKFRWINSWCVFTKIENK